MRKSLLKSLVATAVVGATMAITSVAAMADGANYAYSGNDSAAPTTGQVLVSNEYGTVTAYDEYKTAITKAYFKQQNANPSKIHKFAAKGFSTNGLNTSLTVTDGTNASYRMVFKYVAQKDSVLRVDLSLNDGKGIYVLKDLNVEAGEDSKGNKIDVGTATQVYGYANDTGDKIYSTYSYYIPANSTVYFAGQGTDIPIYGIDVTSVAGTAEAVGETDDQFVVTDASSDSTYIVHKVTDTELAANSLSLEGATGGKVATTDTVYSSVKFADGSAIEAANGSYLYAVQVTGTGAHAPTATSFTWVTE